MSKNEVILEIQCFACYYSHSSEIVKSKIFNQKHSNSIELKSKKKYILVDFSNSFYLLTLFKWPSNLQKFQWLLFFVWFYLKINILWKSNIFKTTSNRFLFLLSQNEADFSVVFLQLLCHEDDFAYNFSVITLASAAPIFIKTIALGDGKGEIERFVTFLK